MAIRNTLLGGTDWPHGAAAKAIDLNDTFDAVIDWVPIETLSPSGVSTITTTGTLDVYDQYLLVIHNLLGGEATERNIQIRFNGDTGNNYSYQESNATLTTGASASRIASVKSTVYINGTVLIGGKTPAVASGVLSLISNCPSAGNSHPTYLTGLWAGGNDTQITSITILPSSSTITGTIKVYGRNF